MKRIKLFENFSKEEKLKKIDNINIRVLLLNKKYDDIKNMVNSGDIDIDIDNNIIARYSIIENNVDLLKIFIDNGGDIRDRKDFLIRLSFNDPNFEIIDILVNEYDKMNVDILNDKNILEWVNELGDSKEKVLNYIKNKKDLK